MATDAQHINTPSVEELISLLSNSIKVGTSPRGVTAMPELPSSDWIPSRRHSWNELLRLLAIPAVDHAAATIWIDSEQKPTLFICSDNPGSFAEYVTGVIKLLQQVEASRSDSDRSDAAQQLINHVLFRLLDAHAVQYGTLLDKLRTAETRVPPEETALRRAVETWHEGLTYALGVYGKFPNMPLPAHDDGINHTTEFLSWARRLSRAPPVGSQNGFFAHIKGYKIQDSSALDLVKTLKENVVHPLVFLISRYGGKSKSPNIPPPSDVLPLETLEVKPLDAESDPAQHIIDPRGLKYWLSTLVYSPMHDPRISQTVLDRVLSIETVEEWTKALGEGRIHPEATILAHIINTRLDPSEHSRGTFSPIVACTRASCIACVLCYKATAQAYDLPETLPFPFPIEGQMTTFRPCRVPPLVPVVEDKLKKALSECIRTLVSGEIMAQMIPEVKHGDEEKKAVRERLTAVTKGPWSKASRRLN
ncbi:hypothetical protein LXA43DRAFT_681552 [Ganoderma leucocontextum]|nr:hypothetical protein LXA43DRAFT_681552 [Ganoderma leucocontextum]